MIATGRCLQAQLGVFPQRPSAWRGGCDSWRDGGGHWACEGPGAVAGVVGSQKWWDGFGQQNRWFKQQTWWFWSNLTTRTDVENMTGLKNQELSKHVSICFEFKARTPKYIEKLNWMPASDQTKTIYVILQTWIKHKSLKKSFGCFWRYNAGNHCHVCFQ